MRRIYGQQGNPQILRYRVLNADGSNLGPSNVTAATLYVYSTDDGTETSPSGGLALTVSSVVSSTLQPWEVDSIGYNVSVTVPGSYFTNADTTYRVEVLITPTAGYQAFRLDAVDVTTDQTYSIGGL
jgi:hypothetical protein